MKEKYDYIPLFVSFPPQVKKKKKRKPLKALAALAKKRKALAAKREENADLK